ncbi:MAG: hypothetical protein C0467_20725 [Planctomycetaceae bacterium]|nr:hypothetical protein [Planctomycetaceae bacterium]
MHAHLELAFVEVADYDLQKLLEPGNIKIPTSIGSDANSRIGELGGLPMVAHRHGAVSVAALSGLVLALLGAELFAPPWTEKYGVDVWNLQAAREEARVNEEQAVVVEAQRVRILREIEVSGHTATRLIDEKITLLEAMAELEPILRNRTGFECAWPFDPPPTFRHAVARYAITRVEAELRNDPERQALVCARLRAEYAALK